VADLKLKLAMKEAEIQKLQASAVARAAAQQKHIAGKCMLWDKSHLVCA
jgi:uncharacterized protein YqeY